MNKYINRAWENTNRMFFVVKNKVIGYFSAYLNQGPILFNNIGFKRLLVSLVLFLAFLLLENVIGESVINKMFFDKLSFFDLSNPFVELLSILIFYLISISIIFSFNLHFRKLNIIDIILFFFWLRITIPSSFILLNEYPFIFLPKNTLFLKYINIIPVYYLILLIPFLFNFFKRKKGLDNKETVDEYFYPDISLGDLSGTDNNKEKYDEYGFAKLADGIADILIKVKPDKKSFCVGINGQWGSGKTSLIQLTIDRYNNKRGDNNKDNVIHFNPWYFESPNSLMKELFILLEKSLELNYGYKAKLQFHKYAEVLEVAEKTIFSTTLSKFLWAKPQVNIERRKEELSEILVQQKDKIIIVIDDLDRLDGKEVVTILKLIRIIVDFPNIVYLIGYDRDYISCAIKKDLTEYNYKTYLDKIINTEYKVPQLTKNIIAQNLKKYISRKITDLPYLEVSECCELSAVNEFIKNHRDIIKFTNNIYLQKTLLKEEIIFKHLFILELVRYKYPDVINRIFYNIEEVIDTIGTIKDEFRYAKLNLDIENKDLLIDLLNKLFNKENIFIPNSISNKEYYPRYFTIRYFITDVDFIKTFDYSYPQFNDWIISAFAKNSEDLKKVISNVKIPVSARDKVFRGYLLLLEKWRNPIDTIEKEKGLNIFFLLTTICNAITLKPSLNYPIKNSLTGFTVDFFTAFNAVKYEIKEYPYSFRYLYKGKKENDEYIPHNFDLNMYKYTFELIPKNNFWRFGFRFSNHSSTMDYSERNLDNIDLVHIGEGGIDGSNNPFDANVLFIAKYTGKNQDNVSNGRLNL